MLLPCKLDDNCVAKYVSKEGIFVWVQYETGGITARLDNPSIDSQAETSLSHDTVYIKTYYRLVLLFYGTAGPKMDTISIYSYAIHHL